MQGGTVAQQIVLPAHNSRNSDLILRLGYCLHVSAYPLGSLPSFQKQYNRWIPYAKLPPCLLKPHPIHGARIFLPNAQCS